MLLNGVDTLQLGVLIWRQWPIAGLSVVGLFLGINLVISGVNCIALGLNARRLPVRRDCLRRSAGLASFDV